MKLSPLDYNVADVYEDKKIGELYFKVLNLNKQYMDTTIYQKYYITLLNDFYLYFVISYENDEQLYELENILNNTELKT